MLWPICVEDATQAYRNLYNSLLSQRQLEHITDYDNLFVDGSVENSLFDLTDDIYELNSIYLEKATTPIDVYNILSDATARSALTQLDNIIVSTQQLVQAYNSQTTIDPRTDDEIAALIGSASKVDSTTILATQSNILNACVISGAQSDDMLSQIDRLIRTQQAIRDYNNNSDVDQSLNNAIQNGFDDEKLSYRMNLLASLIPLEYDEDGIPIPQYNNNPLGRMIGDIEDDDV